MIRIVNSSGADLAFLADEVSTAFHDHAKVEKARLKTNEKELDAERVLKNLPRPAGREKLLFVTDCGLTMEGFNFVFGAASPREGVAVVSTQRLEKRVRITKEAVHEVGHLFFLNHCTPPCVMSFSNTLAEVDKKSKTLCKSCKDKLRTHRFLL